MRGTLATLAALLALAAVAAPARAGFTNPVVPVEPGTSLDSPDPWIQVWQGRYWMTYSAGRRIVLRSARELGGLATARPRQLWPAAGTPVPPEWCCDLWAPEFHRLHGPSGWRWYVYTSAGSSTADQRLGVLESLRDDPRGPYRFRARPTPGQWSIDPTVFRLRGRSWLLYSGHDGTPGNTSPAQSLFIAPLADPWTLAAPPLRISTPTLPWERVLNPINEGPEVLRRGGRLHVIYSASLCVGDAYSLGRLTVPDTSDLLDPATWAAAKAPDPVLESDPARRIWGPGHNGFFTSPDGRESWIVYHAVDRPGIRGCFVRNERLARAQRFTWTADGTPVFPRPAAVGTELAAPGGDRTLTRQLERGALARRAGVTRAVVRGLDLVGRRGVRLAARRPEGRVTLAPPGRGARRVLARVRVGPGAGRIGRRPLGRRAAGTREIDLGVTHRAGLRVTVAGRVVVDQLRVVAP